MHSNGSTSLEPWQTMQNIKRNISKDLSYPKNQLFNSYNCFSESIHYPLQDSLFDVGCSAPFLFLWNLRVFPSSGTKLESFKGWWYIYLSLVQDFCIINSLCITQVVPPGIKWESVSKANSNFQWLWQILLLFPTCKKQNETEKNLRYRLWKLTVCSVKK
jgi:hypothetical protein